jgi:hypothetical protein
MKGRGDTRFPPQGGGRGRFGRKQGEPSKDSSKLGMKPEIGAYLDLARGKPADPGMVLHWLECLRVYIYANYDSKITEIIGSDGTLNEYPDILPPEVPPDDAGVVRMEDWKADKRKYRQEVEQLEKDCLKVFGLLLGQMSSESKSRIKEAPQGPRALADRDPLDLLSLVVATHMNNKRYGEGVNIITAEMDFYGNKMLPHEDLLKYYTRFKTLLFVKSEAWRMADIEHPELEDELQAIKFVLGLNANYSDYVFNFKNKVRPWPITLEEAQSDAGNYMLPGTKTGAQTQNPPGDKRNVFAANRGGKAGRGGRGGRGGQSEKTAHEGKGRSGTPHREREESPHGEKEDTGYGTRYGNCNNCGDEGHYAYECKKPKGAGKKSTTARNPSSEK